jgi:hypothetical protein
MKNGQAFILNLLLTEYTTRLTVYFKLNAGQVTPIIKPDTVYVISIFNNELNVLIFIQEWLVRLRKYHYISYHNRGFPE